MNDEQERALSDQTLLKLFNSDEDLTLLTPTERSRLMTLTAPKPTPSHDAPNTFDTDTSRAAKGATGVESNAGTLVSAGGRGTRLDVRKSDRWLRDNAPAIGATMATLPMGGAPGWTPAALRALAAFGGGAAGSGLRGDDPNTMAWEGTKQATLQSAPKVVEGLSKAVYKTGIPKQVLDKFRQADVAGAGLENRAVLGTTQGVNAAERGGTLATSRVNAAAPSVPPMSAQDVQAAFRPKYNRALVGNRPDKAIEIGDHVRQSMDEIGLQPMSGVQQLARKEALEPEAGAAMRAVNEKMAATNPQLANIERRAITKNLRQSPEMETALNRSQANVGLKRAALATEHSNPLTRLLEPGGGFWHSLRMPTVSSVVGIAGNEASKALNPHLSRALLSLLSQRSNDEP